MYVRIVYLIVDRVILAQIDVINLCKQCKMHDYSDGWKEDVLHESRS